jgi:hypothetical protein
VVDDRRLAADGLLAGLCFRWLLVTALLLLLLLLSMLLLLARMSWLLGYIPAA